MSHWKIALETSVAALLGLALLVHFGITAAYVAPPSPLRMKMEPVFRAYVEPYFTQQWSLFAPRPLMDTRLLLVSCRVHDPDGVVRDTPYSDITTPLRELKNKYRLSPADRLDRVGISASHMLYDGPNPLAEKLVDINGDHESDAHAQYLSDLQIRRRLGARILTRVASVECDRRFGKGRTTQVQIVLSITKPTPFSERNHPSKTPAVAEAQSDWTDYEPVASF